MLLCRYSSKTVSKFKKKLKKIKFYLVKAGAFAAYIVKIHVIFGVRVEGRKVNKKQTYMKTETCKLYSRAFDYFCQMSQNFWSLQFRATVYGTVSKFVRF